MNRLFAASGGRNAIVAASRRSREEMWAARVQYLGRIIQCSLFFSVAKNYHLYHRCPTSYLRSGIASVDLDYHTVVRSDRFKLTLHHRRLDLGERLWIRRFSQSILSVSIIHSSIIIIYWSSLIAPVSVVTVPQLPRLGRGARSGNSSVHSILYFYPPPMFITYWPWSLLLC